MKAVKEEQLSQCFVLFSVFDGIWVAIRGTWHGAGHFNGTVVKYANDKSTFGLNKSMVLGESGSYIYYSSSMVTGFRQSQGNRIIAENNPI